MTDPTSLAAFRFGYGYPLLRRHADRACGDAEACWQGRIWRRKPGRGSGCVRRCHFTAPRRRAAGEACQGEEQKLRYKAAVRAIRMQTQDATQVMLTRAVLSPDGFRERLVQFWADHFTTKGRFLQDASLPSALVEDAVRPHVAGRFGAIC